MPRRPAFVRVALIALTVAGIPLGHGITYAGLEPGAVAREAWLAATGHGYLPALAAVGVAAAIAVAVWAVLRGVLGHHVAPRPPLGRLVALEMAGFAVLEIVERTAAGSGFSDLARVLPVGLAIQSAIACALALAVRWLHRAGTVAGCLRRTHVPPVRALRSIVPTNGLLVLATPTLGPLRGRAPPISS